MGSAKPSPTLQDMRFANEPWSLPAPAEYPLIDIDELLRFVLPGIFAIDKGAGGLAHAASLGWVGGHCCHGLAEGCDHRFFARQRYADAGAFHYEAPWSAVVDDDARETAGHCFHDDAGAEFADRGEGEHVGISQLVADAGLGFPADQFYLLIQLLLADDLLEGGAFGSIADDSQTMFAQCRLAANAWTTTSAHL